MITTLPADLLAAESMVLEALQASLRDQPLGRWEVTLKFEGLKLMPVAIRLMQNLQENGFEPVLVWPDMGGAALAKHNAPELERRLCYSSSDSSKSYIRWVECAEEFIFGISCRNVGWYVAWFGWGASYLFGSAS